VALSFREVHFRTKEVERLTRQRKKKVVLPLRPELLFAFETERDSRKPQPIDRVLVNPLLANRSRAYGSIRGWLRLAGPLVFPTCTLIDSEIPLQSTCC